MDAIDIDSEQPRPPQHPQGGAVTTDLISQKLTSHLKPRLHLLSLPREIRDAIYAYIVVVHSYRAPGHFAGTSNSPTDYIKHGIQPQILRVNRQIHVEAKDVMLTRNLFVKISSNDENFQRNLDSTRDAILVRSRGQEGALPQFTGYVVHVQMKTVYAANKQPRIAHILLLQRDLPAVIQVMHYAHMRSSSNQQVAISIRLYHPCCDIALGTQAHRSTELAHTLLQPYRDRLRQVKHFKLDGPISTDLKKAVITDVVRPRYDPPRAALQSLQARRALCLGYASKGNPWMIDRIFQNLVLDLVIWKDDLRDDQVRQRVIASEGSSFLREIAEFYLTCNTEAAINVLKSAKRRLLVPNDLIPTDDYLHGRDLLKRSLAHHASSYALRGCEPLEIPELNWQPSSQQLAKLRYIASEALVIDPRKLLESWTAIQEAMRLQPEQPKIRERFELLRKKVLAIE